MFRIAAFSTVTGREAVYKATGVAPRTFPPWTLKDFQRDWLETFDVLYFHLHGVEGQPFWYGDGMITAMSVAQIKECGLVGQVAFVANCFGGGSKMVEALRGVGAVVVAGPGKNFTSRRRVRGADRLGMHFVRAIQAGHSPADALADAKQRIRLWAVFSPLERDALEFSIQE